MPLVDALFRILYNKRTTKYMYKYMYKYLSFKKKKQSNEIFRNNDYSTEFDDSDWISKLERSSPFKT